MLQLTDVSTGYGRTDVITAMSIHVDDGSVTALLGSNGAGKSTTIKAIAGLLPVNSGMIELDGHDISHLDTPARVEAGIAVVPEGGRVFADFSVDRNLSLGAYLTTDGDEVERRRAEVLRIFPKLEERQDQRAATLSGGERQMLAIGRALMSEPRVLVLDEPFLGLAPVVCDQVLACLCDITANRDVSVFVAEQNVRVLEIADHAYGIRLGQVVLDESDPSRIGRSSESGELRDVFFGAEPTAPT